MGVTKHGKVPKYLRDKIGQKQEQKPLRSSLNTFKEISDKDGKPYLRQYYIQNMLNLQYVGDK